MRERPPVIVPLDRAARLRAAFMASPMDENALREATYAYVDETKRHGWPVERVIIEIKRLSEVEDAPLSRALRDPMQRDKAHALIDSVIGWCIARYFSTG